MSRKMLFLCFLLCSGSQCVVAMSLDEAYRAIPHQKTYFDRSEAHMRRDEAAYLDSLFTLINAAIVAKCRHCSDSRVVVLLAVPIHTLPATP